jgi:hypothetical protein
VSHEPARSKAWPLSGPAALVLTAYRNAPGRASRDLRHTLPLTRREYARAWCELRAAGLVPASSAREVQAAGEWESR